MPRYFFDIASAGELTRDEFGDDLPDDGEARDQAVALVMDVARHRLPEADEVEFLAKVRNGRGEVVYEACLSLNGKWRPGQR